LQQFIEQCIKQKSTRLDLQSVMRPVGFKLIGTVADDECVRLAIVSPVGFSPIISPLKPFFIE
jgi:hypothetical protein